MYYFHSFSPDSSFYSIPSIQVYRTLLYSMLLSHAKFFSGRWGEVEIEKGPVDLFPTEPTDEATLWRGDLEPWVQGTPRH